jgi:hypothetical protein
MADENRRTVLGGQGPLRHRHVIGQLDRWILDDGDGVAIFLQRVLHALPSRAVDEVLNGERGAKPEAAD